MSRRTAPRRTSPPVVSPPTRDAGRWIRRVAWTLCAVTFPLLWLGGLVTTTKSGMAVPDWPGTYGYNLFLYPWTAWFYGPWDLFVEHGHRLLASLAGLLTIVLVVLLAKGESRRWLRTMGWIALVGVIAQGVLGGLRVVLDERMLAMVHGSTGPLFFALTVAIAIWTTDRWAQAVRLDSASLTKLAPLAAVAALVTYVQMLLGAMLRHMPVDATPQSFLSIVKFHLIFAAVVALLTLIVARRAVASTNPIGLRRGGGFAIGIVTLQLLLGLATWLTKYGTPVWLRALHPASSHATLADGWLQSHLVTAHQATGSLLLVTLVYIAMWAWRYAPLLDSSTEVAKLPKATSSKAISLKGSATA